MVIRPIHTQEDLNAALARVDQLWGSPQNTAAGDELDLLLTLIEAYEAKNHEIPGGDPIELVRYRMGELNLTQNALARRLGWTSGRVSEVLARKRILTLAMIRALSDALAIPPGLLVGAEAATEMGAVQVYLPAALCDRIQRAVPSGSEGLEAAVVHLLELGLSAGAASGRAAGRAATPPPGHDPVTLRPGAVASAHARLAA